MKNTATPSSCARCASASVGARPSTGPSPARRESRTGRAPDRTGRRGCAPNRSRDTPASSRATSRRYRARSPAWRARRPLLEPGDGSVDDTGNVRIIPPRIDVLLDLPDGVVESRRLVPSGRRLGRLRRVRHTRAAGERPHREHGEDTSRLEPSGGHRGQLDSGSIVALLAEQRVGNRGRAGGAFRGRAERRHPARDERLVISRNFKAASSLKPNPVIDSVVERGGSRRPMATDSTFPSRFRDCRIRARLAPVASTLLHSRYMPCRLI